MKRHILLTIILVVRMAAFSQETLIRSNENHFFDEGKNFFTEQKYEAAKHAFEWFAQTANANSSEYVDAQYYLACVAFELREGNATAKLKNFVTNYPYYPQNHKINYMLGIIYFEEGKYRQAIGYLAKVSRKDLNSKDLDDYYFAKGICQIQTKEYANARTNFLNLQNSQKYYEASVYYAGYCDFCLKNFPSAIARFNQCRNTEYEQTAQYHILQIYDATDESTKAVALGKQLLEKSVNNSNNTEVYRILGENSFKEKDYKDAVAYLKKYEEGAPKVIRTDMYMLGMGLFYTGQYEEAVKYLSKTTSEQDVMAENGYYNIAQSYLKLGDKNKAKMSFQSATAMGFDKKINEEALYNYALLSYETGSVFGESINAINKFLAEYPNSPHKDDAYNLLAAAYMQDSNYASALNSINEIQKPNQKMLQAKEYVLFQLGRQEFDNNKLNEAENYFSQSIKLYATQSFSPQAYLWRGETYFQKKEYAKARADFQNYLSAKQSKPQADIDKANYTIGYSFFKEERFENALEWFLRYSNNTTDRTSSTYYDALNRIGDCYFSKRNFASAMNNYEKVIANAPKQADYAIYQMGIIKGLQKNYSGKINELQNLLNKYPNSELAPKAQYEIGRSYVLMNKYENAIESYNVILKKYSKYSVARKAALEIGMLYENMGQKNEAVKAYKQVIERYPNSEQTNVAMHGLENLYVEANDVSGFVAYKQSLGNDVAGVVTISQEDSLTFAAAEKIYEKGDYNTAAPTLRNYIDRFCKTISLNCITANYYLADSYDNMNDTSNALASYDYLTKLPNNKFMEQSLIRAADIVFSQKNYTKAAEYFTQLKQITASADIKQKAQLGILRCYYQEQNYEEVVDNATIILKSSPAAEVENEAKYCRAKSLIALNDWNAAITDLNTINQDVASETGAEAKYLTAQYYYNQKNYEQSENEIIDFIGKKSPQQYWAARAFVLLSDIYVAQNDDFQAKQYLLSLQENYKQDDDIAEMITGRLIKINNREKQKVY